MECQRCGEANVPGLQACMACGLALEERLPIVEGFVPRGRSVNPLWAARRRALIRSARRPWEAAANPLVRARSTARDLVRELAQWPHTLSSFAAGLRGAAVGLIPGLASLCRGESRVAAAQLVAVLIPLLLVAALWRSPSQWVAWTLLQAALTWGPSSKARRCLPVAEPRRSVAAACLGLTAVLLLQTAGSLGLDVVRPRVELQGSRRLGGGVFLARPYGSRPPTVGDLAVVRAGRGEGHTWWLDLLRGHRDAHVVAPVVAVPGQRVEVVSGVPWVDGSPATVPPLNNGALQPVGPFVVPEGHVVVYRGPIEPTPRAHLVGRLVYRWTPARDRGPLHWPAGGDR